MIFFRNFEPYLGITAHYISKHWTLEKVLVHSGPVTGKHTAVLIAEKLDNVITSLDLIPEMFTTMTTDNAVNMLNAVNKESRTIQQRLGCIDHLLQLVINKSIEKVGHQQIQEIGHQHTQVKPGITKDQKSLW